MGASNNINGSFTIIPQNVHAILNGSDEGKKDVRANNQPVFKGTFAEKQRAILNDIKRLSYAEKVEWNKTEGKTGFSRFLKIVGNILHNFRSHFYSSEKSLADLKRDIQVLKNFGTSKRMSPKEYKQLETFLGEIKKINENNERSLHYIDKCILGLLDKVKCSGDLNKKVQAQVLEGIINSPLFNIKVDQCCEQYDEIALSEKDAVDFKEFLTLKWGIADGTYADQLEQILEEQVKMYKGSNGNV